MSSSPCEVTEQSHDESLESRPVLSHRPGLRALAAARAAATSADIRVLGISLPRVHVCGQALAHLAGRRMSCVGSGSVVCRRRLRVGSPPAGGHEGSHSCLKLPRTGFPVIFRYGGFLDLNCLLLIDTVCESEGSSLGWRV